MNCPNCREPFVRNVDRSFLCETCGWLTEIDGVWRPCHAPPEPDLPEPDLPEPEPPEPEPPEPEPPEPDPDPSPKVTSYLGGLLTVTEIDDDEETQTTEQE